MSKIMGFSVIFISSLLLTSSSEAAPSPLTRAVSVSQLSGFVGTLNNQSPVLLKAAPKASREREAREVKRGIQILQATEQDPFLKALEFGDSSVQLRLKF